jgi:hypothetical protein
MDSSYNLTAIDFKMIKRHSRNSEEWVVALFQGSKAIDTVGGGCSGKHILPCDNDRLQGSKSAR